MVTFIQKTEITVHDIGGPNYKYRIIGAIETNILEDKNQAYDLLKT